MPETNGHRDTGDVTALVNGGALPVYDLPPVSDTSFEIQLDAEPVGKAEPVSTGPGIPLAPFGGQRRDIIPQHLRSWARVKKFAGDVAGAASHHTAFHLTRCPWYACQVAGYAVAGVWKLGHDIRRWAWVTEPAPLREKAVIDKDSGEYRRLHSLTTKTRGERGLAVAGCAAVAVVAGTLIARFAPAWTDVTLAVVAVLSLARYGRPADKPIIQSSMVTPRFRFLNGDVVLRAYYSAGIGRRDKPDQQITFGSPMSRDGEGSMVLVNPPYGVTVDDVVKAKPALASGLDVALSQVYISKHPQSHRSHWLWVADRDPLSVPAGKTPLLACKQTDIWKPAPLGLDERGRLIKLEMIWQSILVGGLPRMGKSWVARLLGLYAALDPYVRLDVFDPSGKPDWRNFALVADSFAFGLTPTTAGNPAEIFLSTLEQIRVDVESRYNRLSAMPTSICPEGKLTRRIARDPDYSMPVRMLLLDEFHEWFMLGEISKDLAELLRFVAKVAPAAGYVLVDATQKPANVGRGDVGATFNDFRDVHQVRLSLRTSSYNMSEVVLGPGAYGEGSDSSLLAPENKGVILMRGATDVTPTVRTHLADSTDAEHILRAARAYREAAGTLSGMAAGQDVGTPHQDVLGDILAVFGSDNGLHWPVLAERLHQRFPDRWKDTNGEALSAQCREKFGVPSVPVKMSGVSLRGCRKEDIQRASAQRGGVTG